MSAPKKKTQKKSPKSKKKTGFSAVEGILMLVIAAIIIFVIWFVYASTRYSDTTLNSTVKTDNGSPKFERRQKTAAPAQQ
jgi:hypothetical protein